MFKFPLVLVRRSIWAGILAQVETLRKQSIKMMDTLEKLTEANIELYTARKNAENERDVYKRESRNLEEARRQLAKENTLLKRRIAELEKK